MTGGTPRPWTSFAPCWRPASRRTATWPRTCGRPKSAGSTPKKYFEAVSQQSGSGPYLPPEAEACRASLHQAEQEIAQIQGQLTALGDPVLVDARLDEIQEASARLQGDYDAIEVAMEALKEADDQLHARFSPS